MSHNSEFFKDLFGDTYINFNAIPYGGGKPITNIGYFNENTINILNQLNQQNREIYFVVNSGGYKGDEIDKINAVFIDLDYGKDDDGNYFPLPVVEVLMAMIKSS
ncbi:hypothetical protein JCM14036_12620 [Desulfotomaculum defluvii]